MIDFTFQVGAQDRYFGMGGTGNGDIFSINADGTNLQVVFQFSIPVTGGGTVGNLIEHEGLLYGTTRYGANSGNGGYGYGALFSFDPYTNTQTVLYSLDGASDGSYNNGGGQLTEYPNGQLYGATSGRGNYNSGTIFSWDPATSTFTKLYDLQGGALAR